ncbi:hypothetical protein BS50DRAFT_307097 [Corynespora cassiicola Philippines]|uniref:Uncharacterized protein n=1 Tax=Corynespora cassiicola Philippines TaxID=1448308 RepID=A0A2T2NYK9_CORCC|nr:hypothetical protein BS50DRAFT_307097 [Corynespora cassiicola Philippines]
MAQDRPSANGPGTRNLPPFPIHVRPVPPCPPSNQLLSARPGQAESINQSAPAKNAFSIIVFHFTCTWMCDRDKTDRPMFPNQRESERKSRTEQNMKKRKMKWTKTNQVCIYGFVYTPLTQKRRRKVLHSLVLREMEKMSI